MLEWVCPICDRAVDPALEVCPVCGKREVGARKPAPSRGRSRAGFSWADVERGFRFGLGFAAVLALVYFLLFLWAYVSGNDGLLVRLIRWLPGR